MIYQSSIPGTISSSFGVRVFGESGDLFTKSSLLTAVAAGEAARPVRIWNVPKSTLPGEQAFRFRFTVVSCERFPVLGMFRAIPPELKVEAI